MISTICLVLHLPRPLPPLVPSSDKELFQALRRTQERLKIHIDIRNPNPRPTNIPSQHSAKNATHHLLCRRLVAAEVLVWWTPDPSQRPIPYAVLPGNGSPRISPRLLHLLSGDIQEPLLPYHHPLHMVQDHLLLDLPVLAVARTFRYHRALQHHNLILDSKRTALYILSIYFHIFFGW
jgi:hypothetical protein